MVISIHNQRYISKHRQLKEKSILQNKKVVTAISVLSLVVIILLAIIQMPEQAVAGSELNLTKSYTSVVIYYGDTLWDIAKDNYNPDYYTIESYLKEIQVLNGISGHFLEAGQTLMVPIVLGIE